MNCKPGDLAVIVNTGRNTKGLLGRVIRVIKRGPDVRRVSGIPFDITAVWVYEPTMYSDDGARINYVNDCVLRPIRPGDVTDEEVRDLYAPSKEPANA